jgi:uncharacterized protein (DUF1778 family)
MKSRRDEEPTGRSRSRRPKSGSYKPILVALTQEERAVIEAAAEREDISVSQFMAQRSASAAKRLLAKSPRQPKR